MTEYEYIQKFYEETPLIPNVSLIENAKQVEVLIHCPCGTKYRFFSNPKGFEVTPIHDLLNGSVRCPSCRSKEWNSISGHSAGFFNATSFKFGVI